MTPGGQDVIEKDENFRLTPGTVIVNAIVLGPVGWAHTLLLGIKSFAVESH